MKPNKEKWIDDVLNSTSKIQRAKPPQGLLEAIEAELYITTKINSIWIRIGSIAAAVMIVLNAWALYQSTNVQQEIVSQESSLISDYQIYQP